MQVPTLPPPIVTTTLPQELAAKAAPNVQAMTPIVPNAVNPTPKSEPFNDVQRDKKNARNNGDSGANNDEGPTEEKNGESKHAVNISI